MSEAEKAIGLELLLEELIDLGSGVFPARMETLRQLFEELQRARFRIVFFGKGKPGKSQVLNALLHEEPLPVSVRPQKLFIPTLIRHLPHYRLQFHDFGQPPVSIFNKRQVSLTTIRGALAIEVQKVVQTYLRGLGIGENQLPSETPAVPQNKICHFEVGLPMLPIFNNVTFVDLPQAAYFTNQARIGTVAYLCQANLVVWVQSAQEYGSENDLQLLQEAGVESERLLVVFNKMDQLQKLDLRSDIAVNKFVAARADQFKRDFLQAPAFAPLSAYYAVWANAVRANKISWSALLDEDRRFVLYKNAGELLKASYYEELVDVLTRKITSLDESPQVHAQIAARMVDEIEKLAADKEIKQNTIIHLRLLKIKQIVAEAYGIREPVLPAIPPQQPAPPPMGRKKKIYISYKWGDKSEEVTNAIDQAFQRRGMQIVRDKRDLEYKGLIREFMQKIGEGDCILVVISDGYLRSENCMFELLEIARHDNIHGRIFPIVLDDAQIYKVEHRLDYIHYWQARREALIDKIKQGSLVRLQGIWEDVDLFDDIARQISTLTSLLNNMNTLTLKMHTEAGFEAIISAVLTRLQGE